MPSSANRQDAIERAKAARARSGGPGKSTSKTKKSSRRSLAAGPDASRLNRSSARRVRPPGSVAPPPPQVAPPNSAAAARLDSELSNLEGRRLVQILNKHFSKIASDIASEKEETNRVLREFEAKKKELQNQARPYKGSGSASSIASDSLVGVEQMLRELHKRNESIKKKEMETKKLYHTYIDKYADKAPKTRAQEDEERQKKRFVKTKSEQDRKIKSTTDIVRYADLPGKERKELSKVIDTAVVSPDSRSSKVVSAAKNLDANAKAVGADASAPVTPGTTSSHISTMSPRSSSKTFKDRTAQRQRENKAVYEDFQKTNENVMERARAKAFESGIAGMKEEAMLRQRNEFSDEDSSDMVTGTREPSDIDDMSYMTEDERLEDLLKKDLARFEFDPDEMSLDGSMETSYAREQKRILDDLEQATKDMEYMASDMSSVASGETWYAYWSEEHQREYYYETHSRRVVWEKPDKYINADSVSDEGSVGASSTGSTGSARRPIPRVSSSGNLPTVQESKEYRGDSGSTKVNTTARSVHDDGSVNKRGSAHSVGSSATYDTYQSNWDASDFMEDGRNTRRASYSLRAEKIRKRRRKRLIRRTLWTVALLCMVLGGVYYYQNKDMLERMIANLYGAGVDDDGNSHEDKQRREQIVSVAMEEDEERIRVKQEEKVILEKAEKVKLEKAEKERQLEETRRDEEAEEKRKIEEENKLKVEEEKQRKIEEEKQRKLEEENQRKLEEEKQRKIKEEKQRKIDAKRRKEEKKRLLEEMRKEEEERQRKIEEEKQRKLEEKRKKEEERQRKIEEKKRKEEERLRLLEEQRKKEEERLRLLEEKRKKEEEELEKQRVLEEKKRKEEEELKALEEKRRKEEEELERRRLLEEKRRKEAEELEKKILEAKRLQEEERQRMILGQQRRKDTQHDTKNEKGGLLAFFMGSEDTEVVEVREERPRHCLIPLAHVISARCRRLAHECPVFDLNGLVDFMMQ